MVNETDRDKERIRLAEADLAQTNDFVKGVLATSAAIRGSAITIWLALLGFAVQQSLAELGLLAAIVAFIFLVVDGYHGWLYGEASKHARAVERLLSTYYDTLSRADDDPDAMIMFHRDLRAHRFGLFLNFPKRFNLKQIFEARPVLFYRVLYPFLIVAARLVWPARLRCHREAGGSCSYLRNHRADALMGRPGPLILDHLISQGQVKIAECVGLVTLSSTTPERGGIGAPHSARSATGDPVTGPGWHDG